jgi:protein-tyrosine phosphatase
MRNPREGRKKGADETSPNPILFSSSITGASVEMIDLHAHILPQLDDGAETMEEAIQMCRISFQDGVRTLVATPHILKGIYENHRSAILAKVQELNDAIKKFGVGSSPACTKRFGEGREFGVQDSDASTPQRLNVNSKNSINPINSMTEFKILPGADVHFSSELLELCENGETVTVNDAGHYLMVEFDYQGIPFHAEEVLFRLIARGIIPIITHPERNLEIGQKPHRYGEMIRVGCLGQVTAMSLTGGFGSGVRRIAEKLLKNRWVHIIASDTHSIDGRPPILSVAVRAAEKIVGREEAEKMVTEYPQAILDGKKPNVPEPLSPDRGDRW